MNNANDRQVDGVHYRSAYQHWDFAADMGLGYFEGQISKYLTRHRHKNGRVDAEKALHFAQKLLELARIETGPINSIYIARFHVDQYAVVHGLTEDERAAIGLCCTWTNAGHVETLVLACTRILNETYSGIHPSDKLGSDPFVRTPVNAVLHTPAHRATREQFDQAEDNRDRACGAPPPDDAGSYPGPGYVNQDGTGMP